MNIFINEWNTRNIDRKNPCLLWMVCAGVHGQVKYTSAEALCIGISNYSMPAQYIGFVLFKYWLPYHF